MPELQTNILGPIELFDQEKTSETTSAQIFTTPLFDSRVFPNDERLTYECIRELSKDPTVQLCLWAIFAQMMHTPWIYDTEETVENKPTPEMIAFVKSNLAPLRDRFLQQAVFGTLKFGWQPFEVVYKPEKGMIFIDNFKALLQDYTDILVFIDNGKFAGFINNTSGLRDSKILDKYALNINFDVEGTDWYGNSVFTHLQKILSSWDSVQETANRYDRKIAGAAWVVQYPVGETKVNGVMKDNAVIAREILNSLEASGGVAVPSDIQEFLDDSIDEEVKGKWQIDIISAKDGGQSGFIDRQKYLDILKVRAFALTERSLLEGSHGTKEEASVHSDTSLSTVDSRHRLICNELNLCTIPYLMELNFGKKYKWSVRVQPAPLEDTRFNTIKQIYHAILQNSEPENLQKIIGGLNMENIHRVLGLPVNSEKTAA